MRRLRFGAVKWLVTPTLKTSPFCPLVVGMGRGQLAEAWASREGKVGKNPSKKKNGSFLPQFCPGSLHLMFCHCSLKLRAGPLSCQLCTALLGHLGTFPPGVSSSHLAYTWKCPGW